MLPRVVVTKEIEKANLIKALKLEENKLLSYEGLEANISDLRHWIGNGVAIAQNLPGITIVIWNADKLSAECQAVLLKPLEEARENVKLILVVENENFLLPTIVSRCLVEEISNEFIVGNTWWSKVTDAWDNGPAACVSLSDSLSKEDAIVLLEEIIGKFKDSFSGKISKKRLIVLDDALTCLAELKFTNINQKLSVGNFLLTSWKMIKA